MSNPDKQPAGYQAGANPNYPPPPPSISERSFIHPATPADTHPGPLSPSAPYASGGLLPEQPTELEAAVPPSPSQQTTADSVNYQHAPSSVPHSAVSQRPPANLEFPPPPIAEEPNPAPVNKQHTTGAAISHQNPVNVEFPPPPTAAEPNLTSTDQHHTAGTAVSEHEEAPPYPPRPPQESDNRRDSKFPPPTEPHPLEAGATTASSIPAMASSSAAPPAHTDASAAVAPDAAHPHKKSWGERFSQLGHKAAAKLGSPGFLPAPLDKECEKTAQILKSFCKNGVYADPAAPNDLPTSTDPKASVAEPGRNGGVIDPTRQKPKDRTLVTIPPRVISKAVGLAIFTTLRAGYLATGAMGSGILVSRLPDGSWSPPSAIQVLSVGGGFQFGVDIYDCVCVINTREALSAFMNTRVSIGGDVAVSAGPYGAGGAIEVGSTMNTKDEEERRRRNKGRETGSTIPVLAAAGAAAGPTAGAPFASAPHAGGQASSDPAATQDSTMLQPERPDAKTSRRSSSTGFKPVFSYVKSRGFYAGVQMDGTVIVERKDANAAFYGAPVRVEQILQGNIPNSQGGSWSTGVRVLHDVLRGAEAGHLQKEGAVPATAHAERVVPVAEAGPSRAPIAPSTGSAPVPPAIHDHYTPPPSTGEHYASVPPPNPKAAEAAADAEPPAYDEPPPAYVDDAVPRPAADQKHA
ncbi:DUF500 domain protein [Paramyrothecium foliicola]|nr:DUF500 domain protein [Paramyrothecium foliicola]